MADTAAAQTRHTIPSEGHSMTKLWTVVCFVMFTVSVLQCDPLLSYTSVSGTGTYTSTTVTNVDTQAAISPNELNPPNASTMAVHVVAAKVPKANATTYTCNFKISGAGDAGGRVGIRIKVESSVDSTKFIVKVGDNSSKTTTTTSTSQYFEVAEIGDVVVFTITTSGFNVARTAIAFLQVAEAPVVTIIGTINPVYSSHSLVAYQDSKSTTDTDPFREGNQISQKGTLTMKFGVTTVTAQRGNMFAEFYYIGTTYSAAPSIFDDPIYCERISKMVTEGSTYPFTTTNVDPLANLAAGQSSVSIILGSLGVAGVAEVPTIPSGSWFRMTYQIKLYQNCGTPSVPVFSLIHDETSVPTSMQLQMLEKPTVTCTGLEATTFRRAYPTDVPINIMLGDVPAAGKQIQVLDESNTILCSRILDASGSTTVPVVVPSNFVNATFERRIRWISDEPFWNSVYLVKDGLSVRNTYSNSIAGKLTLEGGSSSPEDIACLIRLQKLLESGAIESTQYRYPVILTSGNYQLQDIDPGTYLVLVSPIRCRLDSPDKLRWLNLLLGQITMANATASLGNNADLHSGDISAIGGLGTRDNEVNLFDLIALISRYGTNANSSSWNSEVDLDADGEVTLFDVMIIDRNFMAKGDD